MKSWEDTLVESDASLRHAMQVIDKCGYQIALVVDCDRRLIGTLSDGDVRRGMLNGLQLDEKVTSAMHLNPLFANLGDKHQIILAKMRHHGVRQLPILDSGGIVVGLEIIDELLAAEVRDTWVVIMAGGLGTRLAELTRETPKPMLKIGPRPLLETIIRSFADQGFCNFYLAVNYRANQIESYFADGSSLGVQINYVRETERMGTAGALSLLTERPKKSIFVTNGDLLTKEDFGGIVDAHEKSDSIATMAVRPYEIQVPFGVVNADDDQIKGIVEKPVHRYMVSAGMYVLSPQALDLVPSGQFFDMPSLFEKIIRQGMRARCHLVEGYWRDIGHLSDYELANTEYDDLYRKDKDKR